MNLKIPAKRIFGDNFDPGKLSSVTHFVSFVIWKLIYSTLQEAILDEFYASPQSSD